jgi:alpha-L-fucosidase
MNPPSTPAIRPRAGALCLALVSCLSAATAAPFTPDRASLEQRNPAPDWFRDAKFGIYFHWGVYSVPAFGTEWYPCTMHQKGSAENQHHHATYGDPVKFGYHDFIPQFTAEKFDAAQWAELFAQAGARFAGPVAEHHDNFSMWDSKVNPWNAAAMGPKRDLTGELEKAIRARGMKFVTTFHHERAGIWEKSPGRFDGHYAGVKTNYPGLLEKPELRGFYGDVPRDQYLKSWLGKLVEVIDRYQPDLIWHDAWMEDIPAPVVNRYLAHYFNRATEWGREVVVTVKGLDLPRSLAVEDFEKGRADRLTEFPWLTDDTISDGSWCYTRNLRIKPADEVIDTLVDIVSKNGQLLLNISPMANGTIPDNQVAVLREIGDFLRLHGEAIYGTRPWLSYGEGPTRMAKGGHFVGSVRYGSRDIRYTRSKDGATVYAIALGWPDGPLTLGHVKAAGKGRVDLLGSDRPVKWQINPAGQLVLTPPALADGERPGRHAFAFRLSGFELGLHPDAAFDGDQAVVLEAARATLDGGGVRLEEKPGQPKNIGFWDSPRDSVHWLARLPAAGRYQFRIEYAALAPVRISLRTADGATTTAALPATGNWDHPAWADLGSLDIPAAGVRHLMLVPADPASWKAVNVWSVRAAPAP